jgi:hypothetical protein
MSIFILIDGALFVGRTVDLSGADMENVEGLGAARDGGPSAVLCVDLQKRRGAVRSGGVEPPATELSVREITGSVAASDLRTLRVAVSMTLTPSSPKL